MSLILKYTKTSENAIIPTRTHPSDIGLDLSAISYIKNLNSIAPNGYNLKEGGSSGKQHEETKKKISDTLKNRTNIIDIIRPKPQLGKPHTEETKQKISNALKGRKDIIRNCISENKKIFSI